MKIPQTDFTKLYEVAIQFGAILAVVALYHKMFFNFKNPKFYLKLIVATIPALIIGFIFSDKIDAALGNPIATAIILIVGGFILLGVDPVFNKVHQKTTNQQNKPEKRTDNRNLGNSSYSISGHQPQRCNHHRWASTRPKQKTGN